MRSPLLCALALTVGGLGCNPVPPAEGISYMRDERTGLCFAVFPAYAAQGYSNVPCTAEVLRLVTPPLPTERGR